MTTPLVLRFKGAPTELAAALEQLQRKLPGIVLTPKTPTLLEAKLDEEQVPKLLAFENWDVTRPSYVEIDTPSINMDLLREMLRR